MEVTHAYPPRQSDPTNSLGIAGFVVSLLGLVASCGLLSPIGAVMSLIALNRRPRGFAIAGLVLGLIGSLWLIVLIIGIALLGIGGVVALVGFAPQIETTIDQLRINAAVQTYVRENGSLPQSIDDLAGLDSDDLLDPWDQPFRIEPLDDGYSIVVISAGPDLQVGTEDDIRTEFDHRSDLERGPNY